MKWRADEMVKKCKLLVIGYGNTLRADDGIGPRVAEVLEEMRLPDVKTLICHQLSPELADPISRADEVLFVDAGADGGGELRLREVQPRSSAEIMAHAPDPGTLLALACTIFGGTATGWFLTIPVSNLGFGEGLSKDARRGVDAAVKLICSRWKFARGDLAE